MSKQIGLAVPVGSEAPELDLQSTDGSRVRLADLRGSPVLVSFLSHAA